MKPSQRLTIDKETNEVTLSSTKNYNYATVWKQNKLVFKNITLKDLCKKLERKYKVTIEIKNKELEKYHYDGTFDKETIKDVLLILSETLPIKCIMNQKTKHIIIIKK